MSDCGRSYCKAENGNAGLGINSPAFLFSAIYFSYGRNIYVYGVCVATCLKNDTGSFLLHFFRHAVHMILLERITVCIW